MVEKVKIMEIKFRFWDKEDRVMIDWVVVRQTAFNRGDIHLCYDLMGTSPRIVKMQFTGLLDKNGREIYEGDLCKWPSGNIGKIIWDEHKASFSAVQVKTNKGGRYGIVATQIEVIGNIHENSELITP